MTSSLFRSGRSSLALLKLSGAAILAALAAEAAALLLGARPAALLVGHGLALAAAFGAARSLVRLERVLGRAVADCDGVAKGDLELRILEIPEPGVVGTLQNSVNHLLDIADAFVRAARGSMQAVGQGAISARCCCAGCPARSAAPPRR